MNTSTQRPAPPRMVDQTGVRFGLATGALVLALLLAGALPLDRAETAVVALLVAGFAAAALPARLAVALGVVSWAMFTGFFENGYGVLTLSPADLSKLVGFVAVTVVLARLARARLSVARPGGHGE